MDQGKKTSALIVQQENGLLLDLFRGELTRVSANPETKVAPKPDWFKLNIQKDYMATQTGRVILIPSKSLPDNMRHVGDYFPKVLAILWHLFNGKNNPRCLRNGNNDAFCLTVELTGSYYRRLTGTTDRKRTIEAIENSLFLLSGCVIAWKDPEGNVQTMASFGSYEPIKEQGKETVYRFTFNEELLLHLRDKTGRKKQKSEPTKGKDAANSQAQPSYVGAKPLSLPFSILKIGSHDSFIAFRLALWLYAARNNNQRDDNKGIPVKRLKEELPFNHWQSGKAPRTSKHRLNQRQRYAQPLVKAANVINDLFAGSGEFVSFWCKNERINPEEVEKLTPEELDTVTVRIPKKDARNGQQ